MPIPSNVSDLLTPRRYGVSFPCATGCQMRFVRNGRDLGGFYSFRQWGGARKAVEAAISRNRNLQAKYRFGSRVKKISPLRTPNSNTGVLGVSGQWKYDKRRDHWEWRYQVRWQDRTGKSCSKSFYVPPCSSADWFLHALRTAIQFRKAWEAYPLEFEPARYKIWRTKRLYLPGTPDLPSEFFAQCKRDAA